MKDSLLESARRNARRAVRAYVGEEWHDFYADAGIALEHLAKATLASYHPTLIVGGTGDGADFDTMLVVLGLRHLVKKSDSKMRTVTCREAFDRCVKLFPLLRQYRDQMVVLLDARNGVLHLAQVGQVDATPTLVAFAEMTALLLDGLKEERLAFWGDFADVVESRLSESASEVQRRVADKLAEGRSRFTEKFRSDPAAPALVALKQAFEARVLSSPEEQPLECPACAFMGVVVGYSDVKEHPDWGYSDGEPYLEGVALVVEFYPAQFVCSACDLVLEDDEFPVAGVDQTWELDDEVDPAEYWGYDNE